MQLLRSLLVVGLISSAAGSVFDRRTAHEFTGLKVRLQTADVAATVSFYRDVLGLEVVVDGPHERPWGSVHAYLRDPNGVQVIVYAGTV